MIYILDEQLRFCPEDGSLKMLDEDVDFVVLTPIPNRILQILVENQGKIITREMFLVYVWDNYGRSGSSNSLKQYIGLIRKVLSRFLKTECIITVTGQGYTFSQEVNVRISDSAAAIEPIKTVSESLHKSDVIFCEKNHRSLLITWFNSKIIWSLVIVILLVSIGYLINRLPPHLGGVGIYPLTTIENCKVYGFNKSESPDEIYQSEKIMNHLFTKNAIKCSPNDVLYFYSNSQENNRSVGMYSILSVCGKPVTNATGCITYRTNK